MSNSKDLADIRASISEIDEEILSLLAKRKQHCVDVITSKDENGVGIRDLDREKDVLLKVIEQARSLELDSHYVQSLYNEILADSNRQQRKFLQNKINQENLDAVKVTFHKTNGRYANDAISRFFADKRIVPESKKSIKDTLADVESGVADFAALAIENNTAGSNNEVYDHLLHTRLSIVGEIKVKITPNLIAQQGCSVKEIKEVFCHPQDALLCTEFIASNNMKIKYLADHETAAEALIKNSKNHIAGITGALENIPEGLEIIEDNIGNQSEIFSRFIIVARKPIKVDFRVPAKTSIVFTTKQEAGALATVLNIFKEYGINLTKLESRPVKNNNWEESFYLDFEGNHEDQRIKDLLNLITRECKFIKVLGCYPQPDVEAVRVNLKSAKEDIASAEQEAPEKPATKSTGKKSSLLSSRDYKAEDTIIDIQGKKIGGDSFVVMAGPCSVESYEQIMDCARHASEIGCDFLRGGCFKPRTSPYSFQGMGYEGLEIMKNAGQQYNLPIITEVLSNEDVHKVAETADILQIGARNMQNFSLLSEVGRTQRPVLLKRGMSSSISDLLNAAEYILAQGNMQVMFCERGIRTFETATRFTLDLGVVPVLRQRSHLPIIIDPSHAAGVRDLVPAMALAAKAAGAHGIIIEFHPEPEKAKSDGPQALRFPQMAKLMEDLKNVPVGPMPTIDS